MGLCTALLLALCVGCATNPTKSGLPDATTGGDLLSKPLDTGIKLPENLKAGTEPSLKVYMMEEKQIKTMPLEEYLHGVLAGEMKNDWPLEALKAQAILARTFVLKFISEKKSIHEGADISTDIEEAQAYDAAGVNERIRQAVAETKGVVLNSGGTLPFGWFHAHSGGVTALAKEGLEYDKDEPPYTHSVKGNESDKAPEDNTQWTATFPAADVVKAAHATAPLESIQLGKKGESGRATTLEVNGKEVPAASFRIALGSKEMKSTLLESVKLEDGKVTFAGKGYGHGVGMSQWGAYGMADKGEGAEAIVTYYFKDVQVARLW
jgi:stage II sporulation protein D